MYNNIKKIFSIIILACIFMLSIINYTFAANPIENPNDFKPGKVTQGDINGITEKSNSIIGAITTVGVVASAITMIVLGIKYMIGSVDERAEYKKSMIPYIIGCFMLFATSVFVSIIANLVQGTDLFK